MYVKSFDIKANKIALLKNPGNDTQCLASVYTLAAYLSLVNSREFKKSACFYPKTRYGRAAPD